MATFLNIRTTDAGQALLADVHAGIEELTITHVAFGSGIWEDSEHSAMSMTALKSEVIRVAPSGGKQVGGEAELTCVLTNSDLDTGFALTEIGIIAQRKDKTEVLYMADAVPSARSTWISSKNEYRVEIPVALRIVCSSTSDVEIRVESTSPVTNEDLDNHNTADNAHVDIRQELATHTHRWTNITDKPDKFPVEAHTHTSSEVGLGNLPNAKDDSVTSSRSDVLATSKAVKTAYDKGVAALNTANTKAAASHTHTPLQVGLGNLPNAKSDSVTSASNAQLATSKAVKVVMEAVTAHKNNAVKHLPVGGTNGDCLKWINGSVAWGAAGLSAANFPSLLQEHGWQKLPSGLILQWGVPVTQRGRGYWTYPIAFPNKCLIVLCSQNVNNSHACCANPDLSSEQTLKTQAKIYSAYSGGADGFYAIAVGY